MEDQNLFGSGLQGNIEGSRTKSKRCRLMELIEEDEEKEEEVPVLPRRRRLVKKIGDDFDCVVVATPENEGSNGGGGSDSTAMKTRSRRLVKVGDALKKVAEEGEKSNPKGNKSKSDEGEKKSPVSGNGVRTSPRLAKRESN